MNRHISKRGKGFTMIELIMAAAIIVIIAGIAIPAYYKSKETLLGKDAKSSLNLIAAAEKIYRMKYAGYTSCNCSSSAECDGAGGCNALLKTNLTTQNWAYAAVAAGGTFTATAARIGSGGYLDCVYTIDANDNETAGAGCP
jgi:prepilin-type N-terminal cleavage/methylation domain-containing protein